MWASRDAFRSVLNKMNRSVYSILPGYCTKQVALYPYIYMSMYTYRHSGVIIASLGMIHGKQQKWLLGKKSGWHGWESHAWSALLHRLEF